MFIKSEESEAGLVSKQEEHTAWARSRVLLVCRGNQPLAGSKFGQSSFCLLDEFVQQHSTFIY
jgi:hypothetical protein